MNGYERIAAALAGEWPDRVPVMLHNFLMAAREAGFSQRQFRESPAAICGQSSSGRSRPMATTAWWWTSTRPRWPKPSACRSARPRTSPRAAPDAACPVLRRGLRPGPARCRPAPAGGRYGPRPSGCSSRALRGDEVFIRGNCDQAPFSLAGLMRGQADWLMDLIDPASHEAAFALLGYCERAVAAVHGDLVAGAGADMLSNGDSPGRARAHFAGALPGFCAPIRETSGRSRTPAPASVPPAYLRKHRSDHRRHAPSGADALELDYKTDVQLARDDEGSGGLRRKHRSERGPGLGTPALVEETTRGLLDVFADTPRFILNAGCAIPPILRPPTCDP